MPVFWDLKLYSLCTLKNQVGGFSKTLATIHQTAHHHVPEYYGLIIFIFKITDDNHLVKSKLKKCAVQESYAANVCVTENSGILGHEVVRNSNPISLSLLPVGSQHLRTVHTTEHHIHSSGFHATAAWMLSEPFHVQPFSHVLALHLSLPVKPVQITFIITDLLLSNLLNMLKDYHSWLFSDTTSQFIVHGWVWKQVFRLYVVGSLFLVLVRLSQKQLYC